MTASGNRQVDAPDRQVGGDVIHAALEAIITVDEEQRIVMINPAAERMFGCLAGDVLGSPLSRFIPERLRAAHAAHVNRFRVSGDNDRAMGGGRPVTGLRADGAEFPVEASISRTVVERDGAARTLTTVLLRDLSPIANLQASYAALQKQFHIVVDLAPTAIWLTHDELIAFANRASVRLFGAPNSAALVGRSVFDLLRPDSHEKVRRELARIRQQPEKPLVFTERIERLDGTTREVEVAVAAVPTPERATLQMVITDITERLAKTHQVERSQRELRRLSAALVRAREEERRRIARELHDELGQRLSTLKIDLSAISQACAQVGERMPKDRMDDMLTTIDETVAAVRRIASHLRPPMLDDLGLAPAIDWLAAETIRRTGLDIRLRLSDCDRDLDDQASTALYRMVQESLTNVVRHAGASRVWVDLGRVGEDIVLTVEDDGIGFAANHRSGAGSFGLLGMRERAHMLGGSLEIGNRVEGGGRIRVRLPLRPPQDDMTMPEPGALS